MESFVKKWRDISISKKLYWVVGIMATLMICELLTLRFAMQNLSAARALVGGEGLWSNAQKNAAISIQRYGITRDEDDYQAFLQYLKVPEGDHIARMEMSKPDPDLKVVHQGFLQGQLHPDDIPPTVNLIRRFHWVPYLAAAISSWTKGDELLAEFKKTAIEYRAAIKKQNRKEIIRTHLKLKKLNEDLTLLENRFSYELGAGSRWLEFIVLTALSIVVFIVEGLGLLFAFMTSRSISQGLHSINRVATEIGKGNFSASARINSNDEIGQLAKSVNQMGKVLQKSYQELEERVEQRTAELVQSKKQLDVILSGITDGITVIDDTGHFIYTNEVGARMCGFSSVEEFLNTPQSKILEYFEIMDEDGNHFPADNLPSRLAFQGVQNPPEVILRFRLKKTKEDRWALVKSTPVFDETRKMRLVVTIFKDFTEHKRSEDALKFLDEASRVLTMSLDYKTTLQTLAQLTIPHLADWCSIDIIEEEGKLPQNIALAHGDPKRLEWAKELETKYPQDWNASYGAAKVLRTGKSEFYPDISDQLLEESAKDEEHLRLVRELGIKSALIVPLSSRNKTFGVLTMISAESSRRYTTKDLVLAEELARRAGVAIDNNLLYLQAQKAIQVRDAFLSIASHELKTPLTSLSLQIQMTQKNMDISSGKIPAPEKLHKVFDTSHKLVDRLSALVEDLLDASRIHTGKFNFNFETVNLSELVYDMINRFSSQLAKVNCALEISIQENIVGKMDSTRMEQVMDNLITNIIKYAPNCPIKIELTKQDGHATLIISDSGPGISMEKQEKIFERFERANESPTTPGLGLGLFIVKEIVKGHQGTIDLKSDSGKGTQFTVNLPLA